MCDWQEVCLVKLAEDGARYVKKGNIVAKCNYPLHSGMLTPNKMKEKNCEGKHCAFLQRLNTTTNPYWIERQGTKQKKIDKKKQVKEEKLKQKQKQEADMEVIDKLKILALEMGELYIKGIKITSIRKVKDKEFVVFYVSSAKKDDSQVLKSAAIKVRLKSAYDVKIRYVHVKGLDGKYMTVEEYNKIK